MSKKKHKNQPEFQLQCDLCEWLDWQWPSVKYISDTVASIRLTYPQQNRNKKIQKQGFKCPDLLILRPALGFCGCYLELKVKSPWKKNGDLYAGDHLRGQWESILELRDEGFYADFAWGFERTQEVINKYLTEDKSLLC